MGRNSHQKKRVEGRSEPVLKGVAAEVHDILSGMDGIEQISCGAIRQYTGRTKIKVPARWSPRRNVSVDICDAERGVCRLHVKALKAAAVLRILTQHLIVRKYTVVREERLS